MKNTWNDFVKPIVVLGVICLVTSLLLAVTNNVTAPIIAENAVKTANATRQALLPSADTFTEVAPETPTEGVTAIYKADNDSGYVITAQAKGYGGEVPVMVAFNAEGTIEAVQFLDNDETPGLGQKVKSEAFQSCLLYTSANYGEAVPVLYSHNTEVLNLIQQRESVIDKLEVNISNYLVKVTDRELNESESHAVNELINFIVEYERIGDYAINVVERSGEMFDKEISFSESARRELSLVDNAIKEIMDITLAAFQADDTVLAEQVEPLEETIDLMIDTLRERHILRLKNGVCAIESGIIFLEILTNLERISDHCSNIAARIVGKESEDDHFDAHEFRRNMHDGYVPNFNEMLAQYKLKYYTPLLESQETA